MRLRRLRRQATAQSPTTPRLHAEYLQIYMQRHAKTAATRRTHRGSVHLPSVLHCCDSIGQHRVAARAAQALSFMPAECCPAAATAGLRRLRRHLTSVPMKLVILTLFFYSSPLRSHRGFTHLTSVLLCCLSLRPYLLLSLSPSLPSPSPPAAASDATASAPRSSFRVKRPNPILRADAYSFNTGRIRF
jgi:hypothetical protein